MLCLRVWLTVLVHMNLSITVKSHSLHLLSLLPLVFFIPFLVLSLSHMLLDAHVTLQSNLSSLPSRVHCPGAHVSPDPTGQVLVGGSVATVDEEGRQDSGEKGDERGPSACPAPCSSNQMEQERRRWAVQNPAQRLTRQERARTCPWMNAGCRRGVLKLNLTRKWLNFTQWSHFFPLRASPLASLPLFLSLWSWSVHTKLCLRLRESALAHYRGGRSHQSVLSVCGV